jgi:hypothetical protein
MRGDSRFWRFARKNLPARLYTQGFSTMDICSSDLTEISSILVKLQSQTWTSLVCGAVFVAP